MFPKSSIGLLNKHICQDKKSSSVVEWYLVLDQHKFHVYVAVAIQERDLYVRIDWHDNSTLCFEPYQNNNLETHVHIGTTSLFCRNCILDIMKEEMQTYKLFRFNCRTVSYLVLTKAMSFNAKKVFHRFNSMDILCGLDQSECLSLEEIHHYIAYAENKGEWCNIF